MAGQVSAGERTEWKMPALQEVILNRLRHLGQSHFTGFVKDRSLKSLVLSKLGQAVVSEYYLRN